MGVRVRVHVHECACACAHARDIKFYLIEHARETESLLLEPALQAPMRGLVLAATCSSSALYGLQTLDAAIPVLGVSGVVTNAPLMVREIAERSDVTVLSSRDDGSELAEAVVQALA